MRVLIFCLVLLFGVTTYCDGANILGVFPGLSKSHLILCDALVKELAEKGHNVTMLTTFPSKVPPTKYKEIALGDLKTIFHTQITPNMFEMQNTSTITHTLSSFLTIGLLATEHVFKDEQFKLILKNKDLNEAHFVLGHHFGAPMIADIAADLFEMQNASFTQSLSQFLTSGLSATEYVFNDKAFKSILENKGQYDVIIMLVILNEAHFVLGHHLGAPVIALGTTIPNPMTNRLVGNPAHYSYIPEVMITTTDKMTFFERLKNAFGGILGSLYVEYFYLPYQEKLMHKYFPDAPSLHTVITSTSLVLVNSHVSMGYPRPMVPNMIEIGGFHVKPSKKLPKDLQQYLDEAPHGVVYFSMGSNLKSANFPIEKRDAFLKTFAKLKQKVLWKWEDDSLPGQPSNLKLGKWLPQQDILAHPNVKVFISHGGMLSTTEAVTCGVPIIGIPIFGDQDFNMRQASALGYAVLLEYDNITTQSVEWALNEVLNNKRYVNNVKDRSAKLNDQPETPMERAVYWVEYVARHKGAPHLRSAAVDLNTVQYLLLDVLAFTLIVLFVLLYSLYFILKKVWNCFRRKTNVKKKRKMN